MLGKRFIRALVVMTTASLVMAAAAFADTVLITNDVTLNTNVTKAAGTSGTGYIRLDVTNGTPSGDQSGCNAPGSEPLTVNLVSDNAGVTLPDSSIELTSGCGIDHAFTYNISSGATGTAIISVSSVSGGKTDGTRLYATTDTLVITITGPSCTAPAQPTISATGGTLGDNDWYTAAPTLSSTVTGVQWATAVNGGTKSPFNATVPTLGVGTTTVYAKAVSGTCESTEASATFKVDPNAPVITDDGFVSGTAGANGWYTSAVTNEFSATDGQYESGFDASFVNPWQVSSGTNEGSLVRIASGAVSDLAGNEASSIDSAEFKIDLSDPYNVAFSTTLSGTYYYGFVPSAPTCTADDDISGLGTCIVTGYGTGLGSHTLTATATDNAGRTATATTSYTVDAWTTRGFYSPVDMNGTVNTIKGGQTVPLKFELFAGSTELKQTMYVSYFRTKTMSCDALTGSAEDGIEITSTGGTSLRFDTTGDQFIQNWQTPKASNVCYAATVGFQDGSSITAYFKTK